MKVRFQRYLLEDSMKTLFEPKDWNDFIQHCLSDCEDIIPETICCELYVDEPDDRIGWKKTYIISAEFTYSRTLYPIGFSEEDIMSLKEC